MANVRKLANELVDEVKIGLARLAHQDKKGIRDLKAAENIIHAEEGAIVSHLKEMVNVFDSDVISVGKNLKADPFQRPNTSTLMSAFIIRLEDNISIFNDASVIMLRSEDQGLRAVGGVLNGLKMSLIAYRNPFRSHEMKIFSNANEARAQLIKVLGEFGRVVINALEKEKAELHQREMPHAA